jgi:hypothetical protein
VARAVRIEYGGAFLPRDGAWESAGARFHDEADRVLFYQTLGEACVRTGSEAAWVGADEQ